jgi:hypothetical protein
LQADVDGTLNIQMKAVGGFRALDAARSRVEPKLLRLIDDIVSAADSSEPGSSPTEARDTNSPSCDRQEPEQRSVGSSAAPIAVEIIEEQQGVDDLESRCVDQNR